MKISLLIFWIAFAICSCHFFQPRDTSNDTPIKNLNQLTKLPGNWKATSNTNEVLKKKNYQLDSMSLTLHEDSSFEIINLPDCINSTDGNSIAGELENVTGNWEVRKNQNRWDVEMAFDESKLFKVKTYRSFNIAIIDSSYQLYTYLGDPDQGEIIMFEKKNNTP